MDRESFDRLMLRQLPAVHRLAIRLCGNAQHAEDLAQEALLRASRAWQSFRGQSRFTTWMYRIVINVFRDELRKRREPEAMPDDFDDASALKPIDAACGRELGELVARHVSNLPPRQREVLVLIAYEQMTPSDVAQVLAISDQSVRTNLHLARAALKQRLKAYLGEACCDRKRSHPAE